MGYLFVVHLDAVFAAQLHFGVVAVDLNLVVVVIS